MDILEFKNKAMAQDAQNTFSAFKGDVSMLPQSVQEFYRKCNPLDVEAIMGGNVVKFYQVNGLEVLQREYQLEEDCFVFATCNSDPIFLLEETVFICCHGFHNCFDRTNYELMADSFFGFLGMID